MYYNAPGSVMLGPDIAGQMIPAAPMQTPTALFRYGEQSLWSTQRLNAAAGQIAGGIYRLFTTPMSQTGQGWVGALSIAETNQKQGGAIPAGQAFDVFGIACDVFLAPAGAAGAEVAGTVGANTTVAAAGAVSTGTIDQISNVIKNGVLSWDFLATTIDIAPVQLVGAGGGIFGAVSSPTQAAAVVPNLGNGTMNNGNGGCWLYRKHPVTLPGQSVFSVLLRVGTRAAPIAAGTDVIVKVILMGYYKTAIEIG